MLRPNVGPPLRGAWSLKHVGLCERRYFSATPSSQHLKLAYDLHEPPKDTTTRPRGNAVIFIHGLFGSKKNNRSISKALARELDRPFYAIDLRNHGDSPHDPRHDYEALAEDVEGFIQEHSLQNSCLIGHSMGAKAAMTVALHNPDLISSIISVDNAPVDAALKSDFGKYVQGMRKVEEARVTKSSEADTILKQFEEVWTGRAAFYERSGFDKPYQSLAIRQFLSTNLVRAIDDEGKPYQKWRIPLNILGKSLDKMADFPYKDPETHRFNKPALFVRGTKSHYVADDTLPLIGNFFPRFELKDVEAGHWLISENPQQFHDAVVGFLEDYD